MSKVFSTSNYDILIGLNNILADLSKNLPLDQAMKKLLDIIAEKDIRKLKKLWFLYGDSSYESKTICEHELQSYLLNYIYEFPNDIDKIDKLLELYALSILYSYMSKFNILFKVNHFNINQPWCGSSNLYDYALLNGQPTLDTIKYLNEETNLNINNVNDNGECILHSLFSCDYLTLEIIKYIFEETPFDYKIIDQHFPVIDPNNPFPNKLSALHYYYKHPMYNIFHCICMNKLVTLEMIKYILEETPIDHEGLNQLSRAHISVGLKKPIEYIPDDKPDIKEYLLKYTKKPIENPIVQDHILKIRNQYK